jgi:hypothetical protein
VLIGHFAVALAAKPAAPSYVYRTRPVDRAGKWGLWLVVLFLVAGYIGAAFGPPPSSVETIAWAGLIGGAVTALLGYWVDRHRTVQA